MGVEIVRARTSDRGLLENLLHLYLHDFSEIFGTQPDDHGRFVYERLPLYWREPGRDPWLVRADGVLAGFALVSRGSLLRDDPEVSDLAEFFVLRGLRRRGVGSEAARQVFASRDGRWEVRVIDANAGALAFWSGVVTAAARGAPRVEPWEPEPGSRWTVFRFTGAEPR